MKRANNLYRRIHEYENLRVAFVKAARGKCNHPAVLEFRKNFRENIHGLRRQIADQNLQVGDYSFFKVFDPKPRNICAAPFRERVLHHAIMNVCEPVLESCAIFDSYACRTGKGNRKAVARAQKFSRNRDWYLKLDIRKYFDSIDHEIAMEMLERRFKEKPLPNMFRAILNTYRTAPGKGVPIGNLISQHLANFYLGRFDHWVKETRRVKAYLRYMDDFILFGHDKTYLKTELALVADFLKTRLSLDLKENVQLNRCAKGVPFLGYRVFPHTVRLGTKSRKRFAEKFRRYERKWANGQWTTEELVAHTGPLFGFAKFADSCQFRSDIIERYGVSS